MKGGTAPRIPNLRTGRFHHLVCDLGLRNKLEPESVGPKSLQSQRTERETSGGEKGILCTLLPKPFHNSSSILEPRSNL